MHYCPKKVDITCDKFNKALSYLTFLIEKRDGKIKARVCADGRSQMH